MKFWSALAIVAILVVLAVVGAIGAGHAVFLGIGWGLFAIWNLPAKK